MMSELSPELEELMLAYKAANSPTVADSERVLSTLRLCLGDTAVLGAKVSWATAASLEFLFAKSSAVSFAGLVLLSGIGFFAATKDWAPFDGLDFTPTATVTSRTASVSIPSATSERVQPHTPAVADVSAIVHARPERAPSRAFAPSRARDTLGEEVALLSRAEQALRSGNPAAALEVLVEHERRFSNGLLTEERIAARAQALCALGRSVEADVQLARLSPTSVHGHPTRQACPLHKSD